MFYSRCFSKKLYANFFKELVLEECEKKGYIGKIKLTSSLSLKIYAILFFLLFGLLIMASSLKEINDTMHNIISFDLVFLFIGIWVYFFSFFISSNYLGTNIIKKYRRTETGIEISKKISGL